MAFINTKVRLRMHFHLSGDVALLVFQGKAGFPVLEYIKGTHIGGGGPWWSDTWTDKPSDNANWRFSKNDIPRNALWYLLGVDDVVKNRKK